MKRRRFRVRNLFLAWSAYWLGLIVVGLSPAILAIWRMSRLPGGQINAAFGDQGLTATVLQNGITTYSGSISFLTLILLIALPPLVMWALFLWTTRTRDAGEIERGEQPSAAALNEGTRDTHVARPSSTTSRYPSREGS